MADLKKRLAHLLTLAANAGTEGEAAAAYAAAQRLMTAHQLQPEDAAQAPEFAREILYVAEGAYLPSWTMSLATALASANKCNAVHADVPRDGRKAPGIAVYGLASTLAEVRHMFDHIRAQVDRLADACKAARGKAGKRAFREGAVECIGDRLDAAARETEAEAQARAQALPEGPARTLAETALAVYRSLPERIVDFRKAWLDAHGMRNTRRPGAAPTLDDAAREAGYEAGRRVAFTGNRALGASRG